MFKIIIKYFDFGIDPRKAIHLKCNTYTFLQFELNIGTQNKYIKYK